MQPIIAFVFFIFILLPTDLFGNSSLLIFSGDIRGEIKPCGCAEEGDMGGLPRRHTFFIQQKSLLSNLFYLDLGNNFPEPSEQGVLKIKLIQAALKKLTPDAVLVGPNEWLNGLHRLDPEIPYLISNQGESLNYLKSITIKSEKKTITIFGYLSPNLVYQNKNDLPLILDVNNELIRDWREKLKNKSDGLKILLFRGKVQELKKFDDSGLFDLIVSGSTNDDELNQVLKISTGSSDIPMIPTKGQGIISAKINEKWELIPKKTGIVPAGLSITWLKRNFEDAQELDKVFMEYNSAVKDLFLSKLDKIEKHKKKSAFVGDIVCLGCHQNSAKILKESRHAKAFSTLEKNNKHFDPECLECHVVGLKPWKITQGSSLVHKKFEGSIGFLSSEITPHLKNVQCENCHGPAREHLKNSKQHPPIKDPKSTCENCHHGSHSPMYNFESYWEKIKH